MQCKKKSFNKSKGKLYSKSVYNLLSIIELFAFPIFLFLISPTPSTPGKKKSWFTGKIRLAWNVVICKAGMFLYIFKLSMLGEKGSRLHILCSNSLQSTASEPSVSISKLLTVYEFSWGCNWTEGILWWNFFIQ